MTNHLVQQELDQLEQQVRFGQSPDEPSLLQRYLQLNETATLQPLGQPSLSRQRQRSLRSFHILLEAICDSCVCRHWRSLCLDNINKPLRNLQRLAQSPQEQQQVRRLYGELATLSHYFQ